MNLLKGTLPGRTLLKGLNYGGKFAGYELIWIVQINEIGLFFVPKLVQIYTSLHK